MSNVTAMEPAVANVPERFVPGEMGGLIAAEHIARYRWAAALANGRRVLDAGCGEGYGSALLAGAGAASVLGVDRAADVLERVAATMPDGVALREDDVQTLSGVADDSVDLVVCFEVIEHVGEQDAALDAFARVLAPGGVLAISSPNRGVYVAGNPHHVHEYEPEELRAALAERFAHVRLLRQEAWLATAVLEDDSFAAGGGAPVAGAGVRKLDPKETGSETYTLALAGDAPLPELPEQVVLTSPWEVSDWVAQRDRLASAVEAERRRAGDLEALARRAHAELALIARERDALLAQEERNRAAYERERERAERAESIYRAMQASPTWRLTAPLRALNALVARLRRLFSA